MRHRRCHAREFSPRRSPGSLGSRQPHLRPEHHRCVHQLGNDTIRARGFGARCAHPPRRPELTAVFDTFQLEYVDTGEATIRVRHAGSGPPVLLLHGHPQTHFMWHAVAPRLAENFTVVATDLRGYGESSKPITTPDHEPYSKRAMARDQVAV